MSRISEVIRASGLTAPGLAFAILGFVPIMTLCLSTFGLFSLHVGTKFIVAPALLVCLVLAYLEPKWGRRAFIGFAAGMVATTAYDATRLAFVWMGVWPDFIPVIGRMVLLDPNAPPIWGYAWRFFLNGGGMGLTFAILPWHGARVGALYGAGICLCLYMTLWLAPSAQQTLFVLTPTTAAAAMFGHLDYGAVLGLLVKRWLPRYEKDDSTLKNTSVHEATLS